MQCLNVFCSRQEAASDIIICDSFVGRIVRDNYVKASDPRLNPFGENRPKAVGGGIFASDFHDNFQPEVDRDVISGFGCRVDGMDVKVKVVP